MGRGSKCATTRPASWSSFGSRHRNRSGRSRSLGQSALRQRAAKLVIAAGLKIIVVPIDSRWMKDSLIGGSQRFPTPAEPERVAPASASRSGAVPRVGAPKTASATAPFLLALILLGFMGPFKTPPFKGTLQNGSTLDFFAQPLIGWLQLGRVEPAGDIRCSLHLLGPAQERVALLTRRHRQRLVPVVAGFLVQALLERSLGRPCHRTLLCRMSPSAERGTDIFRDKVLREPGRRSVHLAFIRVSTR